MPDYDPQQYDENPVYDYGPEKPKRGHQKRKFNETTAVDEEELQGRIIGGIVLIGLGGYFLLRALGIISGDFAWWAFFILIPGLALMFSGWLSYSRTGTFDRGAAFGGLMATLVGAIFLLDISWSLAWPLFLILPGIALLLGWFEDDEDDEDDK